jgi:hypothetical protein
MIRDLTSMTDFVLRQGLHSTLMMEKGMFNCHKYANFLKRPLELGMFIPCDKEGNVLEDPELTLSQGDGFTYYQASDEDFQIYGEAEDRVLFEGNKFRIVTSGEGKFLLNEDDTAIIFSLLEECKWETLMFNTIEDLERYFELKIKENHYNKLIG